MKKVLLILACILPINSTNAYAIASVSFCTNCSNIITQLLEHATSFANFAQSIQQTYQQAVQIQNDIEQAMNIAKNTASLSLDSINNIKKLFKDLSYADDKINVMGADVDAINKVIESLYAADGLDVSGLNSEEFIEYKEQLAEASIERRQQMRDVYSNIFKTTAIQLSKDSADFNSHLDDLLSTPEGQKEALDAANQIAALQVQETRNLTEIMMHYAQAEAILRASALQEKEQEEMYSEVFRTAPVDFWSTPIKGDPF